MHLFLDLGSIASTIDSVAPPICIQHPYATSIWVSVHTAMQFPITVLTSTSLTLCLHTTVTYGSVSVTVGYLLFNTVIHNWFNIQ